VIPTYTATLLDIGHDAYNMKLHCDFLEVKFDQQVSRILLEAKDKGHAIKLRHSKVVICGSSAAGKTNFLNLLVRNNFEKEHKMTGLTNCKHKMIVRNMSITKDDEGICFKNLELDQQIQWLRSHRIHRMHKTNDNGESIGHNESSNIGNFNSNYTAQGPSHSSSASGSLDKNTNSNNGRSSLSPDGPSSSSCEEQRLGTISNDEEKLPEIWDVMTFLDTGGQPEYISMLPALNSAVMVTFIVLSLENGLCSLSQKVTVHEGEDHSYDLSYDYSSLVKMLISMRKPQVQNTSFQDNGEGDRSYLSFIGTKSDVLSENLENVVLSIDDSIQSIVKEAECEADLLLVSKPDSSSERHLIPVSNCHANTIEEDPNAMLIRDAIYSRLENRKVHNVPIEWLLLELEIKQWCKTNDNKSYMTIDEVYTLCKECSISADKEYIKSFLNFYHMLGIFLFYNVPGVDNPIVITNHQWLFDNLSKLVVFAMKAKRNTLDQSQQLSLRKGLMSKKVIEKIKFDLANDYFIKLLEHLKIVAPVSTGPKDCYFVPCILPTYPIDNDDKLATMLKEYGSNHNARPLLIQISNNSKPASANLYYGLPRGVFGFLIVDLLKLLKPDSSYRYLRIRFSNKEGNACIYHNLVIFQYFPVKSKKHEYYIILIDRFLYLEIQIRSIRKPESNFIYIQIRDLIKSSFTKVCEELNYDANNVCVAFMCSKCKNRHLARKSIDSSDPFYCQKTNTIDWYEDNVWFSQVSRVYNSTSALNT